MISKKDAITLGILGIAGIAAASAVSGGVVADTGAQAGVGRVGGILGTYGGAPQDTPATAPTILHMPAEGKIFPDPVDYSSFLKRFLVPSELPVSRGAAGVSSAGKAPQRAATQAILTPKKEGVGFGVMPATEVGFAPTPGYIAGVGYGVGVYPVSKRVKSGGKSTVLPSRASRKTAVVAASLTGATKKRYLTARAAEARASAAQKRARV